MYYIQINVLQKHEHCLYLELSHDQTQSLAVLDSTPDI